MKIFVYNTPEAVPSNSTPDCAIAIDVLRATTTIATALAAGAEGVQVFSDLQALLTVSESWDPSHRIRIGERGGKTVEGFDMGNSPLDCTPDRVQGDRIFMSTTNGTRALTCVQAAQTVLTAAFINRAAVVQYLLQHRPTVVWLVGSGWEGTFSLEDTGCAGAVIDGLLEEDQNGLADWVGNDEAIAAWSLYRNFKDDIFSLLKQASHGQRLLGLNLHRDLQYCAQVDALNILPMQQTPGVLAKG